MTSDEAMDKAREIVYGIRWTDDRTLLDRIAQALMDAQPRTVIPSEEQMTKPAMDLVREALEYIAELDKPIEGASECFRPYMERAREALSKLPKVPSKDDFEVWCNKNGIVVGSLDIPLIYGFLVGD